MNNRMTADDGFSVESLLRRIGRAEQILLQSGGGGHSRNCNVEMDPEGITPCNCGASSRNSEINKAIRVLRGKA